MGHHSELIVGVTVASRAELDEVLEHWNVKERTFDRLHRKLNWDKSIQMSVTPMDSTDRVPISLGVYCYCENQPNNKLRDEDLKDDGLTVGFAITNYWRSGNDEKEKYLAQLPDLCDPRIIDPLEAFNFLSQVRAVWPKAQLLMLTVFY